ncbi:MAG: phage portal protein, partial [Candidatus Paceibacterota bacterium]
MKAIVNHKEIEIKETIVDRAIGYFSPEKQAQRMRARAIMAYAGSYVGASYSRRGLKSWVTSQGDADSDTLYDLDTLRQRSRDLARNAPLAVGAISANVTNVVGTGLKLQSRIDYEYLGLTEDQADAWEANAERWFQFWAESQECDAARTLTFYLLQELAFRQTIENGDSFTLTPRFKRSGSPFTLKLMLVEADRVCNINQAPDKEGLIAGIQKDTYGAPVAYHIMNTNPFEPYVQGKERSWKIVPAFGSQTGLRNVIHLYRMLRPGQTRGVPYLAPVIETLKQLDRYTEAEIMAAVISSMFTVFIKTETGDENFDVTEMGEETGATTTDTDMKLASGAVIDLAAGESIETANPNRPNSAFDPFVQAILQQIGTALEIPYEILIRHFSSSYSASRAALLEAWRFFKTRRQWLAVTFCQPIYEIWLYEQVAAGVIPAPGFFADPMTRKAYSGALWVGDAPGYIDPAKDIDAAVTRMESAISTLDEETTLITGGDFT